MSTAIIVDVEATTAIRQAEVLAAKRTTKRSMERFDLHPAKLMGDSAYGSADMLGWLVREQGIEPHVTVFDKSARSDGTFSRDDFTYDHDRDIYICPGGRTLTTTGTRVNDAMLAKAEPFVPSGACWLELIRDNSPHCHGAKGKTRTRRRVQDIKDSRAVLISTSPTLKEHTGT